MRAPRNSMFLSVAQFIGQQCDFSAISRLKKGVTEEGYRSQMEAIRQLNLDQKTGIYGENSAITHKSTIIKSLLKGGVFMNMQQDACEFFSQILEMYLVSRDTESLLKKMQPEVSWVGTGANEIGHGIAEARQTLELEIAEYGGSFQISDKTVYAKQLSDNVCVVYGAVQATPEHDLVEEQRLHFTAICVRTDNGIMLAHCNVSRPDMLQTVNNYYVPPQQRADNEALRDSLEHKERWIENLTQHIPGGVHQCQNDPNLTLVNMSDSFLDMLGYTKEDVVEKFQCKLINMVYPEDRAELLKAINKQLSDGTNIELEYRVVTKNQGPIWVLDMGKLLEVENKENCFYCVLVNITQRKKEQEELRLSLERHQIIMDQAADIIFEWDIVADTLIFSPHWRRKFGYEPICNSISRAIPLSKNIHPDDSTAFVKLMRETAAGMPYSETEFRICDINGKYFWNRIRATAQFDASGRAIKAVGVITDISEEKEERIALMEQAQTDALTGLYNKEAIKTRVELRMKDNIADIMQALLIIDVDYFKQVNDTYGHLCGDAVLSDISDILRKHFRASDLIGRIGGDEFLVYMPAVLSAATVQRKVDCVQKALLKVRPIENAAAITCSIGVAVCPYREMDYFGIYQAADKALYYQKSVGRNGVSFYNADVYEEQANDGIRRSAVNAPIDSEMS